MAPNKLRQRKVGASDAGKEEETLKVSAKKPEAAVSKLPSKSSFALVWKRFLKSYTAYVGNSLNQDKLIKTLQYSLWMLNRFYYGKDDKVARAALSKLWLELSWARYVSRLFGLPTAIEAASSGSWAAQKSLGKAMAWMMIFYYPLENLAYFKWQAPQWVQTPSFARADASQPDRLAARASAWSCRFWLVYIVLDVVRSTLALQPALMADAPATTTLALPSSDTKRNERLQIVRNALFFLPAIHWSLPNWDTQPWLTETACNSLMWLEAVVCLYQSYRNIPPIPDESCPVDMS